MIRLQKSDIYMKLQDGDYSLEYIREKIRRLNNSSNIKLGYVIWFMLMESTLNIYFNTRYDYLHRDWF